MNRLYALLFLVLGKGAFVLTKHDAWGEISLGEWTVGIVVVVTIVAISIARRVMA